ncbi:MAG: amino-acid N-acetyltransferase [Gammaproteobacteria bacterium]
MPTNTIQKTSLANGHDESQFVAWFRGSSPYINAFRGRTFVIMFGGEAVADERFANLIHDVALLNSLGVRLVLVHGARPQIEQRLRASGTAIEYAGGLRVTGDTALTGVKEAVGMLRVEIEALLSMGLANSPMAGARIRAASGNFVAAKPLGVRDGVDYCHTGEVRRIDVEAIRQRLDDGAIVLLSPLGYSPTGEVFNLTAIEVATATAAALNADKLLCLVETGGLMDAHKDLVRQLTLAEAEQWLSTQLVDEGVAAYFNGAVRACRQGVRRAHLVDRHVDGALLLELFTRDGIGTLITSDAYEDTRKATIDDVGGILELIAPLEAEGVLVRRSRERLETEIEHFTVVERDGMIIATAALYPFKAQGMGELACLAVHPAYRNTGRGEALLGYLERIAVQQGIHHLFALTTHTPHWFQERGFQPGEINDLPITRQRMYNYQRKSKVFIKVIQAK